MFPQMREQIISKITTLVPRSEIYNLIVIGSITGYKYTDTSDIDVNVSILPYDERYKEARHAINGFNALGTRHPVNFYFTEHKPDSKWEDAVFGVYSILFNKWLAKPPTPETVRDPEVEFRHSIAYAKMKARQFDLYVRNMKRELRKLLDAQMITTRTPMEILTINRLKRNTIEAYKRLVALAIEIDNDRKLEYHMGWGIPRRNYRNIVFKLIEYGPHGPLFEYLKELD